MTLLLPLIVATAMAVAPMPVRPESDVPVSIAHERLIHNCAAPSCDRTTRALPWRAR